MGKRIRRKSKKPSAEEAAAEEAVTVTATETTASTVPADNSAEPTPSAPQAAPAEPAKDEANNGSDDEDGPRKRRRTRRRRKNRDVGEVKIGPDPATFEGLSEGAQKALVYAQAYTQTRQEWKFSKPRQNWLIRHILWSPAIHSAAVLAAESDVPEAGAWVPDEYVPVVSVYLASVQGSALQRLLDGLAEAEKGGEQDQTKDEVNDNAASTEDIAKDADKDDETSEKTNEAASEQTSTPAQLRAERASFALRWINSRLYADA
ncbi:hypothetical protein MCUN1_000883 [Malassezia cuniculi]|uniref:WKF domain-containing protein n=1 Tax=Malassezia cuniculi TaxID=948313 RepID=A0AAF0ERW9_9BASI|nr:hypothetical protein MCUN1_000883 [Malassezia cuniculi]